MIKYIKCPRCELNYIDSEKQEYCDVCIAEMAGNKLQFADLDDEDFDKELESEGTELCPICGVNYMPYGEKMCESCKSQQQYEEEEDIDPEQDEEWKNYLDDDTEDLSLEDAELDEELKEELEEDAREEEESEDDDDYYEGDADEDDDFDDLGDEDFDDDDEDEDDEEDDDDDDF